MNQCCKKCHEEMEAITTISGSNLKIPSKHIQCKDRFCPCHEPSKEGQSSEDSWESKVWELNVGVDCPDKKILKLKIGDDLFVHESLLSQSRSSLLEELRGKIEGNKKPDIDEKDWEEFDSEHCGVL